MSLMQLLSEMSYHEKLTEHSKNSPSAQHLGKDTCQRCGRCCLQRPGTLSKTDVGVISAHLGLTAQEFFQQYCMVDYMSGNVVLILRRHHQEGGDYISSLESWSLDSPCVFYENNGCQIHKVKPHQCYNTRCWDDTREKGNGHAAWTEEDLKSLGWDGICDW